ncbi:MAG: FAD-dependent oxidoreductase [Nocardioides sp.]
MSCRFDVSLPRSVPYVDSTEFRAVAGLCEATFVEAARHYLIAGVDRRHCVVVGGGIAGLVAAYAIGADSRFAVTVVEAGRRIGGTLVSREVAGIGVDVGAEAMLFRRPEGAALLAELGLPPVHPTSAQPRIWSRGELCPLPRTMMGVPLDVPGLLESGVLSADGVEAVRREAELPPSVFGTDVSVGELVAGRMGPEVVDRLVEPLLGGVYAGRARELSAMAVVPTLAERAREGSWGAASPPPVASPVFVGTPGGLGVLPDRLAATGRFEVRRGSAVRRIRRTADGFALEVGSPDGGEPRGLVVADDVVLAVPPSAAATLLSGVAPRASHELDRIPAASVAVITLAVPEQQAEGLDGRRRSVSAAPSGFLVPPVEGLVTKAATFSWRKWDWVRAAGGPAGIALLRTSCGRYGEALISQRADADLVAQALADLTTVTGRSLHPIETHVQRWPDGLPQYLVGHRDRVARIREAVAHSGEFAGRLAVCGAAYDGVGVPAVIASAHRAAAEITADRT